MHHLLLRVLAGTSLIFIFKLYQHYQVHIFQAIIIHYTVNHIGIIRVGALGAGIVFQERLTKVNITGIGVAVMVLILISYQKIAANLF